MKKLVAILLLTCLLSGCDDEPEGPQMGCLTGTPMGQNYRAFIRCCTEQEYLAGSNVSAGGTSNWNTYEQHQWKEVKNCSDC